MSQSTTLENEFRLAAETVATAEALVIGAGASSVISAAGGGRPISKP